MAYATARTPPWDYAAAERAFFALIREGIKYDLDNIHRLLGRLRDPHRVNRWIHVTGTNGKGSTSAMAESILRARGEATVLYTSPHLVSPRERFRLDGLPVSPEAFAEAYRGVDEAVRSLVEAGHPCPTFFEAGTALAFVLGAARPRAFGVAEVGMGGRLDATNVLVPEVSVITSIALDHVKTLGDTPEKIAWEKACIAKPGVPMLVPRLADSVLDVIRAEAGKRGAPVEVLVPKLRFHGLGPAGMRFDLETPARRYRDLVVPLLGEHQLKNAALAVRAVELACARTGRELPEEAVRRGLARVWWPGRFDLRPGTPSVVLDGAHNPEGMASLAAAWDLRFPRIRPVVLMGACFDKSLAEMMRILAGFAGEVVFTQAEVKRAAAAKGLRRRWLTLGLGEIRSRTAGGVAKAWQVARGLAGERGLPLLVTGSLYLLGEVMGLSDGPGLGAPPLD